MERPGSSRRCTFNPRKRMQQCGRIGGSLFGEAVCRCILVIDAQAAAGVHVFDAVAVALQHPHQFGHAFHGQREGLHIGDLRADVHAHARNLQILCARGLRV